MLDIKWTYFQFYVPFTYEVTTTIPFKNLISYGVDGKVFYYSAFVSKARTKMNTFGIFTCQVFFFFFCYYSFFIYSFFLFFFFFFVFEHSHKQAAEVMSCFDKRVKKSLQVCREFGISDFMIVARKAIEMFFLESPKKKHIASRAKEVFLSVLEILADIFGTDLAIERRGEIADLVGLVVYERTSQKVRLKF